MLFIRILVALACMALLSADLHAWSYGVINTTQRPGDSGTGCATCHGAAPGGVDVQVDGYRAVLPGLTARYSVIISNISNPSARAGFTAAVTGSLANQPTFSNVSGEPTATADGSTQIVNNNNSLPLRLPTNGSVAYLIDLTMPAGAALADEFTVHAVGDAGHGTSQAGWDFAPAFTITIGPPTPVSLMADQNTASTTEIPLAWAGSTQGEHFRVLGKSGDYPNGPGDVAASLVYEGPDSNAVASGLDAGTRYFFKAWGKVPSEASYSAGAAETDAATLPENPGALIVVPISGSEILLQWSGASSEYRLLRRIGEFPISPDDQKAVVVFEGSATEASDIELSMDNEYRYGLWGKVTDADVFSADSSQALWRVLIHADRFEADD